MLRARRLPGARQCSRTFRRLWACTSISMRWNARQPHTACRTAIKAIPPTPAAAMAAHGLLAAAARRTRLVLLFTSAPVQRLRQYRPTRANLGQPSPAPPCASAIPVTPCATARWPWTASWACPGGAAIAVALCAADCAFSSRRFPTCIRNDTIVAAPHDSRPETSQTLYLRLQGQRVLRRAPDRLTLRASISLFRLASNRAFKEPTWLRATISAWRHSSARASAAAARATSRLIPQTPLVRVCCQLGRGQRPGHVGLLDPRQLTANILHMHHHAQNDSAIPALLPDPHSSFFIATRQQ